MSTTITANRLICVMNWTAADGVYKRSSVQHAEKLIACRTHFSRPRSSGNGFRGAVRPSYWRESDPVQECGPLRRGQNWSIEWHLDLATTADLIHMQAEYVGLYLYLPAQSPAGAHGATLMLYSVAYRCINRVRSLIDYISERAADMCTYIMLLMLMLQFDLLRLLSNQSTRLLTLSTNADTCC